MAKKTKRYSIYVDGGRFHGRTRQESAGLIWDALLDISDNCNIRWTGSDTPKAKLGFYFQNNAQMLKLGRTGKIPAGLKFRKWIALNSSRGMNEESTRRIVKHEICHWLGMRHSKDTNDLMHPNAKHDLSLKEYRWLKRRYGKAIRTPRVLFHTFDDGYACWLTEQV